VLCDGLTESKRIKYTEHKPFGRHYLGVIRTTMSFAVQTFTQVKVRNGITTIIV
jgi:hypothetical protein